jgi:hypothetical protein
MASIDWSMMPSDPSLDNSNFVRALHFHPKLMLSTVYFLYSNNKKTGY